MAGDIAAGKHSDGIIADPQVSGRERKTSPGVGFGNVKTHFSDIPPSNKAMPPNPSQTVPIQIKKSTVFIISPLSFLTPASLYFPHSLFKSSPIPFLFLDFYS